MQRITDSPIERCPRCHRKVRRLISSTSFQLKGSGWYLTDYGRGGTKKDGGAGKSESKSETKSETKSEAKADTSESGKSVTSSSEKTTS